jgi:sulfhydrogenase subunit delta
MECKRRGNVCVMVAHGTPCLGPVTHAGCGALCPTYHRGCYGCYGPMESPNMASLSGWFERLGLDDPDIVRRYRLFYANAPRFREEAERRAP